MKVRHNNYVAEARTPIGIAWLIASCGWLATTRDNKKRPLLNSFMPR